ncbi:MAG: YhgE/Pip domain-containing protein [Gordonibacter pamelaeae]|uniref:YhgE/Pip domain-containing protein n=4 Tax=Gordonibacter pamelaeae TaxID=471189 RepID=A0A369LSN7_9ACTN|nr:YhgE/Pip domain-containing protein [Gordonibacter pamelaeae]MBS4895968.1 YhgE/Pip domain-containing protein [Gordonibacter pamelaeae]MCB6313191.1 YhgE/Pip domain-containing protein [Gordonibacter pamelaeae]MCQ4846547.1 YhgE/Pip domain-containing protein [Gordonibacter pamelaeae]MCQ4850672.1 YhgE/Pip domain-containing protein [Gordonibacter pamelaeae]MSA62879.1 YhgE/Pip domain-containing protein [Gordonibacter pamelaeae]
MSNVWHLFRGDMRRLFSNAMNIIITVGLVVMPSIFAWYNIIACWNVFDNTGNLTVAVANVDDGYESDLVPLRVNIGEQVVSALRANDEIDWTFTTEEDAVDGAKSGRYYAAVVIPHDFSRVMLTFYSEDVHHAKIVYYANEKKSAIAPKITDRGADTVSYQVNEVFAETLSEVALSIAESLSRYADEADASGRIADLSAHVRTMGDQVDRMASVLTLYSSLAGSAQSLVGESAQLVQAAQREADGLGSTASQGAASAASLVDALRQAADGLSQALADGGQGFAAVSASVDALFDAAATGSQDSVAALRGQADALDGQVAACRDIVAQLEALREQVPPEYAQALESAIARMNATIGLLENMRDTMGSAADKLEAGSADVQAERAEIKRLADEAQQSAATMRDEFDANLKPGLQKLADEASSLVASVGSGLEGLRAAGSGLSDSAGSAAAVLGGAAEKIDATVGELHSASATLRDLADGIDQALVAGDADLLREVLGSDTQVLSKALAAPVGIDRVAVFPVDNFGSAMAPLYTTLALFIGSLLILVVVKPTVPGRVRAQLVDPQPRQLFFGRFGVMAFLSLAQTTVMGLGNLLFLQVQVTHPLLFMLCFWLAGFVFTFLIYALVAAFANLGKAVAVLLLIIQVTGCGGSFPLQLLPPFIQGLSPWLPATHVVNAMRAAMFGTYGGDFWWEMGLLALFLIPAAIVGLVLRKPLAKFMSWYVEQVESSKLVG